MTEHQTDALADDVAGIVLEQAERLFRDSLTREVLQAADGGRWQAPLWGLVEESGLPLALVPEEKGGVGLPPVEAFRLLRRSAFHALPLPLAETTVAAALWTSAGGEPFAGACSLAPVTADDRLVFERAGDGYRVTGTARRVPWGSQVPNLLLFGHDETGAPRLALTAAVAAEPGRFNLAGEPRDRLVLDRTALPAEAVRPAPDLCRDGLLQAGALIRAVQMVGAMERALDSALDHANERRQFGRPIAKFQAIQHMLAIAAGQFAAASAAADRAAGAWGTPSFPFDVAVAKARVGEAAGKVAETCHQVLGAMGFTQEHSLHFSTRRLWSWRDEFGHETRWQEEIGRLVCARGGQGLWDLLNGA